MPSNNKKYHFLSSRNYRISISFLVVLLNACTKFVQVDPPVTQTVSASVFSDDATAISTILSLYSKMSNGGWTSGGNTGIGLYAGLSADEFDNYAPTDFDYRELYTNSISITNGKIQSVWDAAYSYIYTSNSILDGVSASTGVSVSVKNELQGEAKFIRAFCYFYLVNLYGDLPLAITPDYTKNAILPRSPVPIVYKQIISDLTDAQLLLTDDYMSATNGATDERVRPNRSAATALLARVQLYQGNWSEAGMLSTILINNNSVYQLQDSLNEVFLKGSKEAIWQLMPVRPGFNTNDGADLILTTTPITGALSSQLLNAFEAGDKRKLYWIDSITVDNSQTYFYPFKYKIKAGPVLTEYNAVLRLAEMFLIRAESEARLNELASSANDLNKIRLRAGLLPVSGNSQQTLLNAIEHERQVELFTEFGHRWLDLKRTTRADAVLGPLKGANWQSTDVLYPIPLSEIQNDQRLNQNPGY